MSESSRWADCLQQFTLAWAIALSVTVLIFPFAPAVGGYLYPNVVKGSQSFAHFATGVASIFSEGMALSSFVLRAFINHQNAVQGRLQLNGTKVTTENQTIRGDNATASITSHTDAVGATSVPAVKLGQFRFTSSTK